ncbi:MAG: T9SS type A sorting domain-containing protein [Bacteroidetes bacterium]|nr:MAG: T9SS type A sorting domain-containing protein [Bacteroidota bacterium]
MTPLLSFSSKILVSSIFVQFILTQTFAQTKKVLLFAPHESCYYSEYIVFYEGLRAAGYQVDVRSTDADSVSTYMLPIGTDIEETANSLSGSSYAQFQQQFQSHFGLPWNEQLNPTPNFLYSGGSILDIQDMGQYDAFAIAGGTGALAYRVDGSYQGQGSGDRLVEAAIIELCAEKINELALEALQSGKPVLSQCHGSSLSVFWRIPNTTGPGGEALGLSILKGQNAAGYPEAATDQAYQSLDVNYLENDPVLISGANEQFEFADAARSRIITTRDWYPQTVAHAARSLINVMESYPTEQSINQEYKLLILHGGALDESNCSAANKQNDVPCNYGGGDNLPADYTNLQSLLAANSPNDPFLFSVSELNITGESLPFDINDQQSIHSYFSTFDGLVFYKHWSTGVTEPIQRAMIDYVEEGGGILALHHGLYNDISGTLSKDILIESLFGTSSEMNSWSANLYQYDVFNTSYGHFVSSYQVPFSSTLPPASWDQNPMLEGSNRSGSRYPAFSVYDEIYHNMAFIQGQSFGYQSGDITPICSNNASPASQAHTTAFVKRTALDDEQETGRLAYFQIGERKENYDPNTSYGQMVRNAALWLASGEPDISSADIPKHAVSGHSIFYPQPVSDDLFIAADAAKQIQQINLYDLHGRLLGSWSQSEISQGKINLTNISRGSYLIHYRKGQQIFASVLIKR